MPSPSDLRALGRQTPKRVLIGCDEGPPQLWPVDTVEPVGRYSTLPTVTSANRLAIPTVTVYAKRAAEATLSVTLGGRPPNVSRAHERAHSGPCQSGYSTSRADSTGSSGRCLAGIVLGLNGNFSARIAS